MLYFLAWLSFSGSLRGRFSVLRVQWERPGAGNPVPLESDPNRPASNDHPSSAGTPVGMPDAWSQKHLLLRNILQSDR